MKFTSGSGPKYANLFIEHIRRQKKIADFTEKRGAENICLLLWNSCSTNRTVSFPLASPPSRKRFEDCWIHQWYSVSPAEPITIRPKVGPTTACVQRLSWTLIIRWRSLPEQHRLCRRASRLPCCSGDLPVGSSLDTSPGTHRLCSSRVSTDRHRQNTRQPLEGRQTSIEHENKYLFKSCVSHWKRAH